MEMYRAISTLRAQADLYLEAADYISRNCQDDEEVDIDKVVQEVAQQRAERFTEKE